MKNFKIDNDLIPLLLKKIADAGPDETMRIIKVFVEENLKESFEESSREFEGLTHKMLKLLDNKSFEVLIPVCLAVTERILGSHIAESESRKKVDDRLEYAFDSLDSMRKSLEQMAKLCKLYIEIDSGD